MHFSMLEIIITINAINDFIIIEPTDKYVFNKQKKHITIVVMHMFNDK